MADLDASGAEAEVVETGADAGHEAASETPQARDYEAEAREHGWRPKEEFRGDPDQWRDAETFMKRADEVMPLLKKKTEALEHKLKDMGRTIRQQTKLLESADKRAYERAVAELKAKRDEAAESGDMTTYRAADGELEKLTKEGPATKAEAKGRYTQEEAEGAFMDWRTDNLWYDKGAMAAASPVEAEARLYADLMTQKHIAKADEMSPPEYFDYIGTLVRERFPTLGKPAGNVPPRKNGSAVAAPTNGRGNGQAKSFNALPVDAQQMCDRLFRNKALPGATLDEARNYYVKHYDWNA